MLSMDIRGVFLIGCIIQPQGDKVEIEGERVVAGVFCGFICVCC